MIENIFQTPLYKSDDLYNFSPEERKPLEDIEMHPNQGGNLTTKDKEILKRPEFERLNHWCQKHLDNFCFNHLGMSKLCEIYITQSWFNINRKHTRHHSHFHPNSLISAILYVHGTSNEGDGSPTIFYRDNSTSVFGNIQAFEKGNPYNCQKVATKFEMGRLILFPSTLLHEVSPTEIDTPRVSLSFNTFFKGEAGFDNQVSLLTL